MGQNILLTRAPAIGQFQPTNLYSVSDQFFLGRVRGGGGRLFVFFGKFKPRLNSNGPPKLSVTIGLVDRKAGKFVRGAENLNDFAMSLTHNRFSTQHKVIPTALRPVNSTLSLENSYHMLKNSYHVLNTDPELVNRAFTIFGSAIQPSWPLDRSDATQMAGTITIDEAKQCGCERSEFVVDAAAQVVQPATPPVISAFDVLVNRPVDFQPSPDLSHGQIGVRLVRNDLLVYLRQNEAFFRLDNCTAACKTVLASLTSILWVVNGQGHKFQTTANVPELLAALIFNAYRVLGHKNLPELSQRAFSAAYNKLAAGLSEPRVRSEAWATVRRDLEEMHASMVAYESYLVEQNNLQSFHRLSRQPVRPPYIGLADETFGSSPTTPFAYLSLRGALLLIDLYEAVDLSNFAPSLPSKRYSFIVNVQLPFPFHVVRRAYGNNKSTRSFALSVDPDSDTKSTRILQESVPITSALPEYHTREQGQRVAEAMSGAGGKQCKRLGIYRKLGTRVDQRTNVTTYLSCAL
jgi:hypothetical protein